MAAKNWIDVVDESFPKVDKVTVRMRNAALRQRRLLRGSVRLSLGRLSTSEEIEARRHQALSKPLH